MVRSIKDPVHGFIDVDDDDLSILNTPFIERLRFIHHLGTGFLIYPGTTHSRFEHSLGVMYLGTRVFEHLERKYPQWKSIDSNERNILKKTLRWACLLHDIGHLPFSHTLEKKFNYEEIVQSFRAKNFKEYIPTTDKTLEIKSGKPHELMSSYLIISQYFDKIKALDVDPYAVASLVLGKISSSQKDKWVYYNVLKNIVNSLIDVDKLDYILRDNYMTGVSLVGLDKERFISSYGVYNNELQLNDKAISVIMNFLSSRDLMYLWVYQHHKVVFTECLLNNMVNRLIKINPDFRKKYLSLKCLIDLRDDTDLMVDIKNNTSDAKLKKMYDMWINRNYLSSCWKHRFELKQLLDNDSKMLDIVTMLTKDEDTTLDIKNKIISDIGINEDDIMMTNATFSPFEPKDGEKIYIYIKNKSQSLRDLNIYQSSLETFAVTPYLYCKKEKVSECIASLKKHLPQYPSS